MAILNAFDALISTGQQAGCNIKFFFRGGSRIHSLDKILEQHRNAEGDLWLICDGPVDLSGKTGILWR
jgi:hypothetical protein